MSIAAGFGSAEELRGQLDAMREELAQVKKERDELAERWQKTRDTLAISSTDEERSLRARAEKAEQENARLREALSMFLTYFGMDEDEWNKPVFDKARTALGGE